MWRSHLRLDSLGQTWAQAGAETACVFALRAALKGTGIEVTGGLYALQGTSMPDERPLVHNALTVNERHDAEPAVCVNCGGPHSSEACVVGFSGVAAVVCAELAAAAPAAVPAPVINFMAPAAPAAPAPVVNVAAPVVHAPPAPAVHVHAPAAPPGPAPEPQLPTRSSWKSAKGPRMPARDLETLCRPLVHGPASDAAEEPVVALVDFAKVTNEANNRKQRQTTASNSQTTANNKQQQTTTS